jgi:MYXO-CTERM domain-containing protein
VSDGDEDHNHNGVIDGGETDPNDPSDDQTLPGAGGASGEGGEAGASGSAASAGSGANSGSGGSSGTGANSGSGGSSGLGEGAGLGAGGFSEPGVLEGGGCSCRTAPGDTGALGGLAFGLAGLGLFVTRRRKRG